jgi:hypothetical protein
MTFLISLSRISSEPPLPLLEEVWERHAYPTNHSSLHMSTRSANGDLGTDKILDTNMSSGDSLGLGGAKYTGANERDAQASPRGDTQSQLVPPTALMYRQSSN